MTVYALCAELNDISGYGGVLGASVTENAGTSYRRTANARTTIELAANAAEDVIFFNVALAGAPNEFWTRFVMYHNGGTPTTDRRFFKVYAGGVQRLSLAPGGAGSLRVQKYAGSAWSTLATSDNLNLSNATRYVIDVFVKLGNPGTMKVFLNDAPVISEPALDLTWAGVAGFDALRFQTFSPTNWVHYSEIIAADWVTVLGRLVTRQPSGAGAYSEWAGGFAVINESPPNGTYAMSSTAGQRLSVAKAAIPALSGGEVIEAVGVASWALRDSGGPQHFNHFLRIAGTDYHKADQNPVIAIGGYRDIWEKSPATGLTFTVSEINGAEPGIRSGV